MMAAERMARGYPLRGLLEGIVEVAPGQDRDVTGIAMDSRKIGPGGLFLACRTAQGSGIPYIGDAVRAGACAVVAEANGTPELPTCAVPLFRVGDLYRKAGVIADRYFGHPSRDLAVIGITGTNGKTTISHLLSQSLSGEGAVDCGLIGSLGYGPLTDLEPGPNTTPDAVTLHQLLAGMRDRKFRYAIMEVSSHGLDQHRIAGVVFAMGIFTNLSRDHLDYHGDMAGYARAKRSLFTDFPVRKAVINLDDETGRSLIPLLDAGTETIGFTLGEPVAAGRNIPIVRGDVQADRPGALAVHVITPWGEGDLASRLTGRFNASNLLACVAALCLLNYSLERVCEWLSRCHGVPGRLERFGGGHKPLVFVDYAHTPDALAQVLRSLKPLCPGRLVCVFGCGGGRDSGKRPLMGAVAESCADAVILTTDNPRMEDPQAIIQDILKGMRHPAAARVEVDREAAIAAAICSATADDIVLIAGKGHERYQEAGGQRRPFSDQQIVCRQLGTG